MCRNCEVKIMNKEGYPDPTAEKAVHNASRIPKYIRSIYKMLNAAAGVSGLEIIGLRDKETGREYRRLLIKSFTIKTYRSFCWRWSRNIWSRINKSNKKRNI